ncbi:unnamed protein product [Rotaria sp. Silwood1]|nr:unnamed protein product [Rotaria sp. Silwood1]CAF0965201.1 unnamed protein product [Rotaria sp. Silwood1]CAF3381295.1 unnamed protein product [Rotaria sp. Silwood1]CAF3408399.1 unnamed protein product [Rotaria sp. Silwood1]CAF3408519.1 unnamed protein product [Rotaria sp. Silwood1]
MDSNEDSFENKFLRESYIVRARTLLRSPLYPIKENRDDIYIKDGPLTGLDYVSNIRNYLWNRKTKRFCARDGLEWAKLGCCYFIYLFALGILFSALVIVYMLLLDKKTPRRLGNDSAIAFDGGINPGLGFRPQLHMDRSLLKWRSSRKTGHESTGQLIDNIQEWGKLHTVKDQFHQQMIDCAAVPRHLLIDYFRQGLSCIFLVTDVKPGPNPCTKPKSFGYHKGRPCILIKINRIFGWIPEPYQSKEEVPIEIRHLWQPNMKNFILIKCFGQYPTDEDLIDQIDHISILGNKAIGGIPTYYYPFLNQPGYRQPYIWAQFIKIESNVLINIICRAYARNIRHSTDIEDMTGAVHFELFFE